MPAIFRYRHTVTDDEIDGLGHASNLEYLKWMQAAAIAHSTAEGWSPQRYRVEDAGWVVRRHTIEYRQPLFAGQRIEVVTWVSNFRKVQSLRKYKIVRAADDTVAAVAATDWAYIGIAPRVPRRIPPDLAAAFTIVSESEEP